MVVVPFEIILFFKVSTVVNVTVSVTLDVLPVKDAGVTLEDARDVRDMSDAVVAVAAVDTVEGT